MHASRDIIPRGTPVPQGFGTTAFKAAAQENTGVGESDGISAAETAEEEVGGRGGLRWRSVLANRLRLRLYRAGRLDKRGSAVPRAGIGGRLAYAQDHGVRRRAGEFMVAIALMRGAQELRARWRQFARATGGGFGLGLRRAASAPQTGHALHQQRRYQNQTQLSVDPVLHRFSPIVSRLILP